MKIDFTKISQKNSLLIADLLRDINELTPVLQVSLENNRLYTQRLFVCSLPWHALVPRLRQANWKVYYWCDRESTESSAGQPQSLTPHGLIFGRYCARLMEWRMVNED